MTAFFILAALTTVLDRAAKLLAQQGMTLGQHIVVLPGVLELRFTHNTGMALGFLSGHAAAGIVLPLLAVIAGVLVLRRFRLSAFLLSAAGLVLGGFLGNFIDRVFFGYVVDMIYLPWLPYFICNPADIGITAGAVLIGVSLLFRPKDWQAKEKGKAHEQNADG